MTPPVIQRWIDVIENGRADELEQLLAEAAVFDYLRYSCPRRAGRRPPPTCGPRQSCSAAATSATSASGTTIRSAILEFTTDIDGIHVNGVDMIAWNDGRVPQAV